MPQSTLLSVLVQHPAPAAPAMAAPAPPEPNRREYVATRDYPVLEAVFKDMLVAQGGRVAQEPCLNAFGDGTLVGLERGRVEAANPDAELDIYADGLENLGDEDRVALWVDGAMYTTTKERLVVEAGLESRGPTRVSMERVRQCAEELRPTAGHKAAGHKAAGHKAAGHKAAGHKAAGGFDKRMHKSMRITTHTNGPPGSNPARAMPPGFSLSGESTFVYCALCFTSTIRDDVPPCQLSCGHHICAKCATMLYVGPFDRGLQASKRTKIQKTGRGGFCLAEDTVLDPYYDREDVETEPPALKGLPKYIYCPHQGCQTKHSIWEGKSSLVAVTTRLAHQLTKKVGQSDTAATPYSVDTGGHRSKKRSHKEIEAAIFKEQDRKIRTLDTGSKSQNRGGGGEEPIEKYQRVWYDKWCGVFEIDSPARSPRLKSRLMCACGLPMLRATCVQPGCPAYGLTLSGCDCRLLDVDSGTFQRCDDLVDGFRQYAPCGQSALDATPFGVESASGADESSACRPNGTLLRTDLPTGASIRVHVPRCPRPGCLLFVDGPAHVYVLCAGDVVAHAGSVYEEADEYYKGAVLMYSTRVYEMSYEALCDLAVLQFDKFAARLSVKGPKVGRLVPGHFTHECVDQQTRMSVVRQQQFMNQAVLIDRKKVTELRRECNETRDPKTGRTLMETLVDNHKSVTMVEMKKILGEHAQRHPAVAPLGGNLAHAQG